MSESGKKFKVFIPLLFSIVFILGMFLGFKLRDKQGYHMSLLTAPTKQEVVRQIINLTQLKYVDSVQVNQLKTDAIQGILKHLDPHSVYIHPSRLAGVNEEMKGSFQGIGLAFILLQDTLNVTQIVPGGPSEKVGLQIGDKIIKVNDSLIAGVNMSAVEVKDLLRGPLGTEVTLTVWRNGQLMPFIIKRDIIPLKSLDAAYMITPDIGYIRISRFGARTYGEFMDAMTELNKHGLDKLILDLRRNPGGYMDAAVNIADELLSDHKLIVFTKGKSYPRKEYTAGKLGIFEKGPLAILVDGGSASASEILSGAVQDWDRGTIIGRRTFGKGLVQEQYRLADGGALRLTVARYFIPSGRSIQKSYKQGGKAYHEDMLNRFKHGELFHADSIHFSDTTSYFTKIKHRRVYGGGGIMPDIFVSLDTTKLDEVMTSLNSHNVLYDFAYRYYSQHKTDFSIYKTPEHFAKEAKISPAVMEAFKQFALDLGAKEILHLSRANEQLIRLRLKALFARERWQQEGYYQVMNTQDKVVHKAIEVLQK